MTRSERASQIWAASGTGFTGSTTAEYAKPYKNVYDLDWLTHGNPQPDKLEQAIQKLPSNG